MRHDESGSVGLLLTLLVSGVSLLGLAFVEKRTQAEMKAEASGDLIAEKLKVKMALKSNVDCKPLRNLPPTCAVGATLPLVDKKGAIFVAADGGTKIGKWNVRIECQAKASPAFSVMIARLGEGGAFLKDPLTRKVQGWTEFMAFDEVCKEKSTAYILEASVPCYGLLEGTSTIPPDVNQAVGCGGTCPYYQKYCAENQREFSECPNGYQGFFRYIDRYGWAGMDFTKYTLCRKISG